MRDPGARPRGRLLVPGPLPMEPGQAAGVHPPVGLPPLGGSLQIEFSVLWTEAKGWGPLHSDPGLPKIFGHGTSHRRWRRGQSFCVSLRGTNWVKSRLPWHCVGSGTSLLGPDGKGRCLADPVGLNMW